MCRAVRIHAPHLLHVNGYIGTGMEVAFELHTMS